MDRLRVARYLVGERAAALRRRVTTSDEFIRVRRWVDHRRGYQHPFAFDCSCVVTWVDYRWD